MSPERARNRLLTYIRVFIGITLRGPVRLDAGKRPEKGEIETDRFLEHL